MSATGEYLAALRARRGMSKYAVAAAAGYSHANIFKIEHGQRFPTPDVIGRLGRAYALTEAEAGGLLDAITADLCGPYRAALDEKREAVRTGGGTGRDGP